MGGLRGGWLAVPVLGVGVQGFFTALDCGELMRWRLSAADLEEWASWAPGRDELRTEQLFRVVVEPAMAETAPALAPALLKVCLLL